MKICTICHTDRKDHSTKLWVLHQQTQLCAFCQKKGNEHSEKLWDMHKLTVEKGQYCTEHGKHEKLYPIKIGLARAGVARVCKTKADRPHDVDFIPIYMSCTQCGLFLGADEEDNADILDGLCLVCFKELAGQPEVF